METTTVNIPNNQIPEYLIVDLMREALGSINFERIKRLEQTKLTDGEAEARAGDVEITYRNYLEDVLDLFIFEQLKFVMEEATDMEKLAFARGTVNGLKLFKEWCEDQTKVSKSRFDKEDAGQMQ